MFTGIIEETGIVMSIKRGKASSTLSISGKLIFDDLKSGDSVSVNGVCLTVTAYKGNHFSADVMRETLERSSLGLLKQGSMVNLERAMPAYGRFGGHIVSGHIDGCGTISEIKKDDNALWYTITTQRDILRFVVLKGSIAVDGVSLTVAKLTDHDLSVSLIPHTVKETTFSLRRVGDVVNLENDVIGKYVERFLFYPGNENSTGEKVPGVCVRGESYKKGDKAPDVFREADTSPVLPGKITREFLIKNGF